MDHVDPHGKRVRWAGIVLFVAVPWIVTYSIIAVGRGQALPSLVAEKLAILAAARPVDTVVVGDSRVMRLGGEPFAERGWRSFNLALNGLAPEDIGLQLKYALNLGTVRRVVMGVSFEAMTERRAFQYAQYQVEPAFKGPEVLGFVGVPPSMPDDSGAQKQLAVELRRWVLPFHRAHSRLTRLFEKWGIKEQVPTYLDDGRANYDPIAEQIARGIYNFKLHRDVEKYFFQAGGTADYLDTRTLAPTARALYVKMIDELNARGIPAILVETGRRPEYQAAIDADQTLTALQRQWRDFFVEHAQKCVRFLPVDAVREAYRWDDFFDPVHYMGETERSLSLRIAHELETVEKTCAASKL